MTFKIDAVVIPDSPFKVKTFPDFDHCLVQAASDNTTHIFISHSEAGVQNTNERVSLQAGVGVPIQADNDDELWAMAGDTSNPELVLVEANNIRVPTGGLGGGGFGAGGGGSGPVVHESTQISTGSSSTAVVSGVTGALGRSYYASIMLRNDSRQVNNVTGMGLSWILVQAFTNGGNNRIEVWRSTTGVPSSGDVTFTLDAGTDWVAAVCGLSGVSMSTPVHATIQHTGMNDSINETISALGGGYVLGFVCSNRKSFTEGTGYTLHATDDVATGSNQKWFSIEGKGITSDGNVAITGTMSGNNDWTLIGVSLKGA